MSKSLIEKLEALKREGLTTGEIMTVTMCINIIRQHEADHCEDVLHMVKTSESSLMGLLEPIADCDWHGKWRIQKAIAILRQHEECLAAYELYCQGEYKGDFKSFRAEYEAAQKPKRESQQPVERCDLCGTKDVSLEITCHNSDCASYGNAHTIYEGWRDTPRAPMREMGWQTIETAPKDGTHILLFVDAPELDGKCYEVGLWCEFEDDEPRWSSDFDPSHWMCLPTTNDIEEQERRG